MKAFQKELRRVHPEAIVYASDSNPMLSAGCQVADDYFEVPLLNETLYIDFLIERCIANSISLIIPTIDTELLYLAKNKSRFEARGIAILISSIDFIEKCRDKRKTHKFFEYRGITVTKEYSKDSYKLPFFIKPIDGSRSIDTYIIESQEDITKYHYSNDKLMFLEYIDHNKYDEYTCDLYYSNKNELKCVVPRKRLEIRDGEVYKAVTKRNSLIGFVKNTLSHIEGVIGCITVQFFMHKDDDTKIVGVEINPRFGGGFPLSYLANANFPKWIIKEYIVGDKMVDDFDDWESDLLMIRYDDEILVHGYKN